MAMTAEELAAHELMVDEWITDSREDMLLIRTLPGCRVFYRKHGIPEPLWLTARLDHWPFWKRWLYALREKAGTR